MADTFKNIRVYWLAFIAYWGIILFGYDTGVAGGVVANTFFREYFGLTVNGVKNQKRIDEVSSNVVSVLQAGAFFGALFSAPVSSKFGRRWTLFAFSIIFVVGAILTTVASGPNGLAEIYAGRVISGLGIGGISAVAPAYVSECSPKEVRGRITGLFQIMVAVGVMLSYFINFGISLHIKAGEQIWKIPFGFQLVPAGIIADGKENAQQESPRWLASVDRNEEALATLAFLRKEAIDSPAIIREMAEIDAAIQEEREARQGLGLKEAFLGKGNLSRFVIAFTIFLLQQWAGQNSVGYYAPQIFESIGYTGNKNSLLASGIYGVIKVVATAIFVFFFVELLGRKLSLFISAIGMGSLFFIIGAILKTHPPPSSTPTRQRSHFVVSKVTPEILTALQYKIFFMFGTINIAGMAVFSLLIPETKGRSLEDMDVIFGSVTAEERQEAIHRQEKALDHGPDVDSKRSDSVEKVV
ncbi:hypothetical protein EYR38_009143 [Pleurotus pulmonarius]|nr:hypothetical protein EYR38_009143 [Pleurotus pulmonarius]